MSEPPRPSTNAPRFGRKSPHLVALWAVLYAAACTPSEAPDPGESSTSSQAGSSEAIEEVEAEGEGESREITFRADPGDEEAYIPPDVTPEDYQRPWSPSDLARLYREVAEIDGADECQRAFNQLEHLQTLAASRRPERPVPLPTRMEFVGVCSTLSLEARGCIPLIPRTTDESALCTRLKGELEPRQKRLIDTLVIRVGQLTNVIWPVGSERGLSQQMVGELLRVAGEALEEQPQE